MTDEELIIKYKNILDSVAEMRRFQREYFKSRKQSDLVEAKRMEQSVDMRLSEIGLSAR